LPAIFCVRPRRGPVAILLRPTYRGELVYNATRKRDPWGQGKTSDRPESQWIRAAAPALRIVSDDVWHAAQARLVGIRTQLATGDIVAVRRGAPSPVIPVRSTWRSSIDVPA
jgi:hypothetical protein